jgi:glycosyltransferase involved in cell wall biosynthesis
MCFGLPVIASDRVGGAYDLVREGETGAIFRFDDVGDLVQALLRVLQEKGRREQMGQAAQDLISSYSIKASVDGIVSALEAVRK